MILNLNIITKKKNYEIIIYENGYTYKLPK